MRQYKFLFLLLTLVSCEKSVFDDIDVLLKQNFQNNFIIEEAHLCSLPPLIQSYMEASGVIGTPYANTVKIVYAGDFKTNEDAGWDPMDAITYTTYDPVSRNWIGEIHSTLGKMTVLDYYYNGVGKMDIRLFPSVPFQWAQGPELDKGELLTILAELPFSPSAFLHENIVLEQISASAVRATIFDAGLSASGTFYFDKNHQIQRFESNERFLVSGSRAENHPWTAYLWDYQNFNGVAIPSKFKLRWHLPEGSFDYIKATLKDVHFNINKR